jgi:hypothetical protein
VALALVTLTSGPLYDELGGCLQRTLEHRPLDLHRHGIRDADIGAVVGLQQGRGRLRRLKLNSERDLHASRPVSPKSIGE